MTTRLVFLVPGFFGFTSVGAVSYFERVEQSLAAALRRRGVADARIVRCRTQPTASIPRRADALRRQVLRPWRKPLVVMTPKSFLRSAESSLGELANGRFERVLGDSTVDPKKVKKILFCFGKVYYELEKAREAAGRDGEFGGRGRG